MALEDSVMSHTAFFNSSNELSKTLGEIKEKSLGIIFKSLEAKIELFGGPSHTHIICSSKVQSSKHFSET